MALPLVPIGIAVFSSLSTAYSINKFSDIKKANGEESDNTSHYGLALVAGGISGLILSSKYLNKRRSV